jgi:hypothetical protein
MAIVLVSLMSSSTVLAENKGKTVIQEVFSNRTDTQASGSGDTILDNCGPSSGNQTATLKVKQRGDSSKVQIEVRDANPNTLYTVWLRMRGYGPGGVTIGGSPMNGAGATPLSPGYALDDLLYDSPPFAGNPNPTNGFTTDANGDADFQTDLDFPVVGGAYPFQKASDEAVQALIDAGNTWPLVRIPSPVVNPEDPNISAPFLIRIVSHCTDQLGHGLSPGIREAWFQYP